jgi:hypothetical protein
MGQFELSVQDIQKEITTKFGEASGSIQKWYPLESRGISADGDITGDLLVKLEIISQNTEVTTLFFVFFFVLFSLSSQQKSSVLFYKWFPHIPHSETIIKRKNRTLKIEKLK